MKNIIELVEKYSLTVKCFPTHKVSLFSYREGSPLKEGDTIVEKEFKNGVVKMVRREEFFAPRWGVKINDWPEWTKFDFYGATAEEAVRMAVEYLENKKG